MIGIERHSTNIEGVSTCIAYLPLTESSFRDFSTQDPPVQTFLLSENNLKQIKWVDNRKNALAL